MIAHPGVCLVADVRQAVAIQIGSNAGSTSGDSDGCSKEDTSNGTLEDNVGALKCLQQEYDRNRLDSVEEPEGKGWLGPHEGSRDGTGIHDLTHGDVLCTDTAV